MGGSGNEFEFLNEEGYSPARRKISTNELSQSMGLVSDRPKGLLMLHAFSDANHFSPGLLFDDFYDWYLQTLEAVRDQPEIDLLVKLHPNLAHYTDDLETASRAYAIARDVAHIHVVPKGLNTAGLAKLADFLITVNGKAGLEFAGCGMPVILGGRGFFAGNGFSEEPQTADAYLEAVARGPQMSQDETQ
jgi:capsule polysaccharide export protein KpsC/LpsZ